MDKKNPKTLLSTFAELAGQEGDLVGPTVEDDIRRAVKRYGADAVRNAVKKLTTQKRGRPLEKDWPLLKEVHVEDAREWLAGRDPLAASSNYSIAKDYADRNLGQSHPADMKRIERKLKRKPFDRRLSMLITAWNLSRENYPYSAHIRTLEELKKVDLPAMWSTVLERARSEIADYQAKIGELPPEEFSIKQVEDAASQARMEVVLPREGWTLRGLAALSPLQPKRKG